MKGVGASEGGATQMEAIKNVLEGLCEMDVCGGVKRGLKVSLGPCM